jgi:hypothetical protein
MTSETRASLNPPSYGSNHYFEIGEEGLGNFFSQELSPDLIDQFCHTVGIAELGVKGRVRFLERVQCSRESSTGRGYGCTKLKSLGFTLLMPINGSVKVVASAGAIFNALIYGFGSGLESCVRWTCCNRSTRGVEDNERPSCSGSAADLCGSYAGQWLREGLTDILTAPFHLAGERLYLPLSLDKLDAMNAEGRRRLQGKMREPFPLEEVSEGLLEDGVV